MATRVITPFHWGSNNGARFRKKASVDGEQSVLHGHRRRRGVKGLAPDHDDSELYWWEQPQHQARARTQDQQAGSFLQGDGGAYDTRVSVVADATILRALQR